MDSDAASIGCISELGDCVTFVTKVLGILTNCRPLREFTKFVFALFVSHSFEVSSPHHLRRVGAKIKMIEALAL